MISIYITSLPTLWKAFAKASANEAYQCIQHVVKKDDRNGKRQGRTLIVIDSMNAELSPES